MRKEKPKLTLNFPKDGVQPKGFKDVSIDDSVTVLVKGTVLSVSENAESWDPGKHLTVKIVSCRIAGPKEKTTMDEAIKEARVKV